MDETRYSGAYDAALRLINPNFDPKHLSSKEKKLYVMAFLDWVKFDRIDLVPKYLESLSGDEKDDSGNTAMFYCKSIGMMNILLDKGADIYMRNIKNSLPVASASSLELFKAQLEIMKIINKDGVPDLNDPLTVDGLTFFQVLIASKSFEVVEWLLENESNPRILGFSPPNLFQRINKNLDTMKTALNANAPIPILKLIHENLPLDYELNEFKLLIFSGYFGSENGVKYFGDKVKDINEEFGQERVTVLMAAAANLHLKSCMALFELGAKPNRKCGNNCCSVISGIITSADSSVSKKLALLKLFAENGASFDETFKNGENLLSLAVKKDPEVFEFIASKVNLSALLAPINGTKLIHLASESNNPKMLPILFKLVPRESLDVNSKGKNGMTPLCLAACHGNKENCHLLLSSGADPDLECSDMCASEYAMFKGYPQLANELKTFETKSTLCC